MRQVLEEASCKVNISRREEHVELESVATMKKKLTMRKDKKGKKLNKEENLKIKKN